MLHTPHLAVARIYFCVLRFVFQKGESDKLNELRKRWEDTVRELTGLEFGKSQWVVENSEKREN